MSDNQDIFFDNMLNLNPEENTPPELISLLSPEEEEEMEKESVPETVSILPLRNTVLFPGVVIPLTVGRDKSIKLINDAYKNDGIIGVVAQKKESIQEPGFEDLYPVGTIAKILKLLKMPDGNTTAIIQGKQRFTIKELQQEEPYLRAEIDIIKEEKADTNDSETQAIISSLRDMAIQIIDLSPNIPSDAAMAIKNIDSPKFLVNFISSNLNADVTDKQSILEKFNYKERAKLLLKFLTREHQMLELKNEIQSKVRTDMDKQQRDYMLHQQLRAIQEELGHDSPDKEIDDFRDRAQGKKWTDDIARHFYKELNKLERSNPASAEYSVMYNYIDTLLELPWGEFSEDNLDLKNAQIVLDEDHYGLEKVKERIIEYLAVLKLKGDMKSPILCLYGPPGVGKTSLGKSIAKALGRKYTRMSLGGLHDESEIRGHRKTYIGAMPGRIIQGIKKGNSSNPVFILDEIDKIGSDFRGDPSSALLEVLDPEQNNAFYDNYLELDYDLSKVLFIATANSLDTIQPALRDRLEIIDINGYLIEEKVEIAQKYLIPKQRDAHGLKNNQFKIKPKVVEHIIEQYTRESGVRGLEKKIASLARGQAKKLVMGEKLSADINEKIVAQVLGPVIFEKDIFSDNNIAGVVTGLAWTPVGGDVLYIESLLSSGNGKIQLTGKLGEVMKESATLALTWLKAHHTEYNIPKEAFEKWDIHIHVPEGATPKEGPSAGVTILTSITSLLTQRKVKKGIAMTGEITLRGSVLPVGGIKEKILAAKRLGIFEIILSEQNKKDVLDIQEKYREGLSFHYVKDMKQVLQFALLKEKVPNPVQITT